jgi:hypothetical protein
VDVLLCAYGGGHAPMLAPVAEKLRSEGLAVQFLALTTAQPYLDAVGVPYIGYADFPEAADAEVQRIGRRLANSLPKGPVSERETIAYLGINYLEQIETHGKAKAEEMYANLGRQAFKPVRTMRRLLDRTQPRLVMTTNSPRSELALLRAAHDTGMPSIALLDMFGLHEVKWLGTPTSATRVGVINDQVRQFFLEAGCLPEQVIVTGNPAFDTVNAPEIIAAGRAWRGRNGLSDNQKVVLWASQPEPEIHPFTGERGDPHLPRRIETELRRIIQTCEDLQLIVRYHPNETVDFSFGDRVIHSPSSEPLHPLLHAADALVVMTSTVGLQGYIAGTPVIAIEQSVISPDAPFSRFGMARAVNDLTQLEAALLLATKQPRGGIGAAGSACEKVVELVKSLT